jgi:hypothetical protein
MSPILSSRVAAGATWFARLALPVLALAGCVTTRIDKKGSDGDSHYEYTPPDLDAATDSGVVTVLPSAMTPLTPELREQLLSSACSAWYGDGQGSSNVLELIVDVSQSMSSSTQNTATRSKWQVIQGALQDVINHLPQSMQLGLELFPNRDTPPNDTATLLDASACIQSSALVPIDSLGKSDSAQRQLIAGRLQNAAPQGGTPTEDAIRLALNDSVLPSLLSQPSGTQTNMILITDGQPTLAGGCRGIGDESTAVDYQPIIDLISRAANDYGVRTFVIGAPGSERDISSGADIRYWLSHAASAGEAPTTADCSDTGLPNFCHYDLSQVPDFTASLERALQSITGIVLSCSFAIPPAATSMQVVDPNAINVVYGVNDEQNQELLIARTDSDCTGEGWHLDATSTNVVLCPETCATIQRNPDAEIHIIGGCQSLVLIN